MQALLPLQTPQRSGVAFPQGTPAQSRHEVQSSHPQASGRCGPLMTPLQSLHVSLFPLQTPPASSLARSASSRTGIPSHPAHDDPLPPHTPHSSNTLLEFGSRSHPDRHVSFLPSHSPHASKTLPDPTTPSHPRNPH